MLTNRLTAAHLFDDATRVRAGDSRWIGHTSTDYWAFVGPFGGVTAATMLRALIDHPERSGDPLVPHRQFLRADRGRRLRPRRPPDQGQPLDAALVGRTDAGRNRRRDLCHRGVCGAPSVMVAPAGGISASHAVRTDPVRIRRWRRRGSGNTICALSRAHPKLGGPPHAEPASALIQSVDRRPDARRIDALSLMAMSDAFFGRIFHVRNELVPFGTVSLTTYFHADAADLMAEDITRVLAVADAKIFHKSFGDQTGELWSPGGRLLATTTQIAYFKA